MGSTLVTEIGNLLAISTLSAGALLGNDGGRSLILLPFLRCLDFQMYE